MEEEEGGNRQFEEEESVKWGFDFGILVFNGMQRKMVGFKLNPEILISSSPFLKKPFGILFLLLLLFISCLATWFLVLWV